MHIYICIYIYIYICFHHLIFIFHCDWSLIRLVRNYISLLLPGTPGATMVRGRVSALRTNASRLSDGSNSWLMFGATPFSYASFMALPPKQPIQLGAWLADRAVGFQTRVSPKAAQAWTSCPVCAPLAGRWQRLLQTPAHCVKSPRC